MGKSNLNAYPYTGGVNAIKIYNRLLSKCEIEKLCVKNSKEVSSVPSVNIQNYEFTLYPNPTTNNKEILIDLKKKVDKINVTLTTIDGKIAFNKSYRNTNLITLQTTSFSKGSYTVTVETTNKRGAKKIVIN